MDDAYAYKPISAARQTVNGFSLKPACHPSPIGALVVRVKIRRVSCDSEPAIAIRDRVERQAGVRQFDSAPRVPIGGNKDGRVRAYRHDLSFAARNRIQMANRLRHADLPFRAGYVEN